MDWRIVVSRPNGVGADDDPGGRIAGADAVLDRAGYLIRVILRRHVDDPAAALSPHDRQRRTGQSHRAEQGHLENAMRLGIGKIWFWKGPGALALVGVGRRS